MLHGDLEDHAALAAGAKDADAVIHCAFNHNFGDPNFDMDKNTQVDIAAFEAMAQALRGTKKPIINTNGTMAPAPGEQLREEGLIGGPRAAAEAKVQELAEEGIRAMTIRLAASVHGKGEAMFVPTLIGTAKKNGYSMFVGDGSARWPAVHVKDAAVLYRLAIENHTLPAGTVLHGVEEGLTLTKEIAEMISKHVDVPIKAVSMEDAMAQLQFIGYCLGTDDPVTREKTVAATGWRCVQPKLLEDMEQNYF